MLPGLDRRAHATPCARSALTCLEQAMEHRGARGPRRVTPRLTSETQVWDRFHIIIIALERLFAK